MVTQITNLIRKIDSFGKGIEFTINKDRKAKTIFGGILTILMILLCLSMFYLNVQDIFYHRNPQINIETKILTESPNITINKNTMPIGFAVYNSNFESVYDPKYFTVSAEYLQLNLANLTDTKKVQYNLKKCTKDSFPLISQEYYDHYRVGNQFCLENNMFLYGSWRLDNIYISYITLTFGICVNKTESDNCAPFYDIKNFLLLNHINFGVLIMDTSISPENYAIPISYNLVGMTNIIRFGTMKLNEIYVRAESLDSDDGFLFPINNINNTIAFDYLKYDDENSIDGKLVIYSIYASNKRVVYKRIYTKIQSVLASVGGIANVLRIAFTICSYVFSVVKRDEVILNKIFEFDLPLARNEENLNFKKQEILLNILNENRKHINTPNNKNQEDNKKKKIFQKNAKIIYSGNLQSFDNINQFNKSKMNNILKREKKDLSTNRNLNNFDNSSVNNVKSASPLKKFNEKSSVNILETESKKIPLSDCEKIETKSKQENRNSKSTEQILNILRNRIKRFELKFSFCEVVRIFLCCKCFMNPYIQTKKALYDKSKFVVEELLDISNIIQKFEEMEKLKIVLLRKNQLALFNFLSNELISLDEEKLKNHRVNIYKNLNKNKEALVDIIIQFRDKMLGSERVEKIDKKLFKLLNPIFK